MLEECIKLSRKRGQPVDPCNVDGRLLVAIIEKHLDGPFQPDARQSALLEQSKFLQHRADQELQMTRAQQLIVQQLKSCRLTLQAEQAAAQQTIQALDRRAQTAAFNKSVNIRNQSLPQKRQLAMQGDVVSPLPRLASSTARRWRIARAKAGSQSNGAGGFLSSTQQDCPPNQGWTGKTATTIARSAHSQRKVGTELQTSQRSVIPNEACAAHPRTSKSDAAEAAVTRPASRRPRHTRSSQRTDKVKSDEERRMLASAAKFANWALKVKQKRIQLPQLCMCHNLSPLLPEYPLHCASNCPLFRNSAAHEEMLKCLLRAYDIV